MLQRVPVILAVTANSYGLQLRETRKPRAWGECRHPGRKAAEGKPAAQR